MDLRKIIIYITLSLCIACSTRQEERPALIWPAQSSLEKILDKGTLDIAIAYNTTDYYVYKGITRGFHYELVKDFAAYLDVKLHIAEIYQDIDTAIHHLQEGRYDLLAASMTHTPEREQKLTFSDPFFRTKEVLVQNTRNPLIRQPEELAGKEIYISQSAVTYKKILRHLADSLQIRFSVINTSEYSYEDLLHMVETGAIDYTVIDENIARACGISMPHLDYSLVLAENTSVSWAGGPEAVLLKGEINQWLKEIKQSGKLGFLYKRYFNNHQSVPQHTSKYALLKKGDISAFDPLLKQASKILEWDWRLLAAIVYTESQFNPEAESEVGAYGLMQVLPETADLYNVTDYFRPDSNVYVGIRYLKYLDDYFSNQPIEWLERIKFVLAAYNAGAGHVLDAMRLARKYGKDPYKWDENVDFYILNKDDPQYYNDPAVRNGYCIGKQAYNYVRQVLDTYANYKNIKP